MAFFDVTARNDEQKIALQYLNDTKPFTFITGAAGTGKNMVSQAVGLHNTMEEQRFQKMIYTRMQIQLGQHLGFLTGDLNEKTEPFMLPFLDALNKMDSSKMNIIKQYLFGDQDESKKRVFFDSVQTLRGRSLSHTYFLLDEAQSIDVHTMEAIASRIDEGSKFVFTGNFAQIDEDSLRDPNKNGMYQLLKGLYKKDPNKRHFNHIHLQENQRSPVVSIVEDIFKSNDNLAEQFVELEMRGAIEKLQEVI